MKSPYRSQTNMAVATKLAKKKKSTKFLKDNHKAAINPERPVGGAKNINANVL